MKPSTKFLQRNGISPDNPSIGVKFYNKIEGLLESYSRTPRFKMVKKYTIQELKDNKWEDVGFAHVFSDGETQKVYWRGQMLKFCNSPIPNLRLMKKNNQRLVEVV